jgi:CRP-like cAMP-binding protein
MADRLSAEEVGRLPLFTGLSSGELTTLAEMAEVVSFEPDEKLFAEGDVSRDVLIMLDGRVTLSMRVPGQPATSFLSLHAGELLGWSSLLARPRVATAQAMKATRVLKLSASDVLELCETDHHVGYAIMRQAFEEMADRVHATRLQLLDMFGKPGS